MKNFKIAFSNRFTKKNTLLIFFGFLFLSSCQKNQKTTDDDLGTFNNPEEAFKFTKQTLNFISEECNNGIENATYNVSEYEQAKTKIFKTANHEEITNP